MKKMTVAIAMSSALALMACGKSGNSEQSTTATGGAPVSEQSAPAQADAASMTDKAVEVGKETWDKTKQATGDAADAVVTKSQEIYQETKETASEVGTAVKEKAEEVGSAISEKSSEVYDAAKDKTGEVINATKEKGSEMMDSVKN